MYAALALCVVLVACLAWQIRSAAADRASLLASFAAEREAWVRERRDLNTRIQSPEVAPFLLEEADDADNDLPVLPEFETDEAALEQARLQLQSVGYEEGPAL